MHGTYVNGKKLASEEEHLLSQGDLITFGTEVIRGKGEWPRTGQQIALTLSFGATNSSSASRYVPTGKSTL